MKYLLGKTDTTGNNVKILLLANAQANAKLRFENTLVILLEPNMELQQKRVSTRVWKMFEKRMLDEIQQFYDQVGTMQMLICNFIDF
jgi:tRNA A37 N6-isopentenylltransferase MiaA